MTETREHFEQQQAEKHRKQQELARKKDAEIKKILSRNDGQEKKKLEDYYKKQNEMIHRKELKEIEMKKEHKEKNLILSIKNRHLIEAKNRFDTKNMEFKNELEKKLNVIDDRVIIVNKAL